MTSQNPFLRPARRWPWITTAVIAVAVAAIAVVFAVTGEGDDDTATTTQPSSTSSQSGPPSNDELADPLAIISGSATKKGVSVEYPKSLVGAVSAAVEFLPKLTTTLDPDRAEEVGELVVDPEITDAAMFRETALNNRKALGITPSGEVPAGASVMNAPVGYQVLEQRDTNVQLLLLGYISFNRPDSGEEQHIGVFPLSMTWTDNDWKLAPIEDDYNDMAVRLDSPEAKTMGWKRLTR